MKRICNHLLTFFTHSTVIQTFLIALLGWLVGLMGRELLPVGCRAIPAGHFNFDPDMAETLGIPKAVIFQRVQGWIECNRRARRNVRNGQVWSYNSYPQWHADIRIFHQKTIEKHIRELEALGLLQGEQLEQSKGKQTKWYTSPVGLSDGVSQMLLWGESATPVGGARLSDDSSMGNQTMNNPPMPKRKTTTPTARGYEALNVGAVAQFSIPTGELPEGKSKTFEAAETHDEHEVYTLKEKDGYANRTPVQTSPPVPPPPSPGDESTEEDATDEMVEFFDGCTAAEVAEMIERYGVDTLESAKNFATNELNRIDNPPGFVRAQLAKGWRPPAARKAEAYYESAESFEDVRRWRAEYAAEGGVL